MSLLPNGRASFDCAPGPVTANLPQRTANRTDDSLPVQAIAIQRSEVRLPIDMWGGYRQPQVHFIALPNPARPPLIRATMKCHSSTATHLSHLRKDCSLELPE